jgi:hypothetical protein
MRPYKPGTIVNAIFNGCHCYARIIDEGMKWGEPFYDVVLLSPCVTERGTIPEGTKTWVWPEMISPVSTVNQFHPESQASYLH